MVVEGHIKNGLELGLRNVIRSLDMFQSYTGHPVDLHVAGDVPLQVRSELTQGISLRSPGKVSCLGRSYQLDYGKQICSSPLN